ncbi:hypothetical protein [Spiroplasma endosymbiont of Nebria brevicollis]|uniref:hypothetical protein n=1 Tax=Spiroplasma endosymbiont of Nebria brevicollis TaxID=3066284 RepID=UPI00313C40BF
MKINASSKQDIKELIIRLEETNSKYKKEYKNQIPYFKRIIEELKKISKLEDIDNAISILKKYEKYCGDDVKNIRVAKLCQYWIYFLRLYHF